jgi:integrase
MGLARLGLAMSRIRVKVPKRAIVPLSVDEVARFWASFHTDRDVAIVGLMLLQGLRSAEVLALMGHELEARDAFTTSPWAAAQIYIVTAAGS